MGNCNCGRFPKGGVGNDKSRCMDLNASIGELAIRWRGGGELMGDLDGVDGAEEASMAALKDVEMDVGEIWKECRRLLLGVSIDVFLGSGVVRCVIVLVRSGFILLKM